MSDISFAVQGLEVFARMRAELGDKRAIALTRQTINRAAKKVRTGVARDIAAAAGIKKGLIDRRLTVFNKGTEVVFRFGGTGHLGRGFVRPRDLGLKVPRKGKYENGAPRYGQPRTTKPTAVDYPRGFVVSSLKGDSTAGNGVHRQGRYAGKVDKSTQLFQRTGAKRMPIVLVPGMRLAELVNLPPIVERANLNLRVEISNELNRRYQVELERIAAKNP